MNQTIAKLFGVVFILLGVLGLLGFAGGTMTMHGSRDLLGLFPVNLLHNIVHILIGLWGLSAARTASGATAFCKQAGVLYLLLTIIGFIPYLTLQLANLVPLGGDDRYLHLAFALILLYFGFMGGAKQPATA